MDTVNDNCSREYVVNFLISKYDKRVDDDYYHEY